MRHLASGFCALTLLALVAAGCTDSSENRGIGGSPSGERTPSASPPTSPAPSDRSPSSMPSTPGGSEMPKSPSSSPSSPSR